MGGTPQRRRLVIAVSVIPLLVWAVLATPVFSAQLLATCPESLCTRFEQPTPETLVVLGAIGLSTPAYAGIVTTLAWLELLLLVGVSVVLLSSNRLRGPLVWVTAVLLAGSGMGPFAQAMASQNPLTSALDVTRATVVAACIPVFVGLFPDGRWHPGWFRRWCPLFIAIEAVQILGFAVFGQSFDDVTGARLPGLLAFVMYLGIQVHRFRRVSDWAARQQAKWVIGAFVIMATNGILAFVAVAAGVIAAYQLVAVLATYVAFGAVGVGLAMGLLRYRLYDVDVVLRRTIVYAAALVALAAGYVGLVAAASATFTAASAPMAGTIGVAVLALGGGLIAYVLRDRIRRRLFGGHGLATAIAALARDGARTSAGSDLAETIASGLGLPYAAVLGPGGEPLWTSGEPAKACQRESVIDETGAQVGALLLGPPRGTARLDRHHRRVLAEVLPFVVLVLRARREADELRAARTAAATAREDERRRLRRDLHDGVGPLLAGQLLTLDTMRLAGDRPDLLAHLEAQARSAIGEVRRVAHDLRPAVLDTTGLPAALAEEAERLELAGLPIRLDVDLAGTTLPAAVEVAALRIAQEALANVVKHAGATAAHVRLTVTDDILDLTVSDNGRGRRRWAPDGVGSTSMRERAQELGGTVSSNPGLGDVGTEVHATIPLSPPTLGT